MDDIGVVQSAVMVDLTGQVGSGGFGHLLDSASGARSSVCGQVDRSIRTCKGLVVACA